MRLTFPQMKALVTLVKLLEVKPVVTVSDLVNHQVATVVVSRLRTEGLVDIRGTGGEAVVLLVYTGQMASFLLKNAFEKATKEGWLYDTIRLQKFSNDLLVALN